LDTEKTIFKKDQAYEIKLSINSNNNLNNKCMNKQNLKTMTMSSDSQGSLSKSTVQEAIEALNLELIKYPKGEIIENIKFKVEEQNGVFEAICECRIKN